MNEIRCLLWDFGDTLVDERIMWPTPEGVPEWTAAWLALDERGLLGPWCHRLQGLISAQGASE